VHRAGGLLKAELPDADVRALMEPLEQRTDHSFWLAQKDGLAIFRSRDVDLLYRLPVAVPELCVIGDSFHTRPLVQYLRRNRRYFVLALAKKGVALYEGSPHDLWRVDVPDLPQDVVAALGEEYVEPAVKSNGRAAQVSNTNYSDERRNEFRRFFRVIDRAVWNALHDERAPLVLACVDWYRPIYREVSRYPFILGDGVDGNVERASPDELHRKAWPLVAARFADEERAAIELYGTAAAHGRGSDQISAVAEAVVQGKVRWLLEAAGRHVWGRLDRATGQVEVKDGRAADQELDLLDDLGELTLLQGGDVIELPQEHMPTRSPVAAVYRY
jgi:hypothetical protein